MPTVADLERLQALVTRLVPLASAQPRTLIRAEDWNLVVGALIELARSVLAADGAAAVGPHDHTDQVQLSWLDGRLRSLLEQGPLTDPASQARVGALERRLTSTAATLDGVRGGLADVRARVDDVTTRDLVREADVTKVRRTVEALGDSRGDVLGLRESLQALREDLQRAIEVGRQLEVDGQPLDVPALVARVGELETLREHLTMPDGRPLDAAELERRLTELTNTLVTEQELDEALSQFHPQLSADESARLKEDILGAADARVASAVDGLRRELGATIDRRLADVDGRVAGAVQAALPGVREQIVGDVRTEITDAVAAGAATQQAFTERAVAERAEAVTRDLTAAIDQVAASVPAAAEAEVGRQLEAQLPELQAGIAALGQRADGLDARAGAVEGGLAEHATVLSGLQAALTDLSTRLDRQIAAVLDKAGANAQQLVDDATARLRTELGQLADQLVADRVAGAINDIRGEMREIARDEVGAALPEIDKRMERILDRELADRILAVFKLDFEKKGPLFQLIRKAMSAPAAPNPAKRAPRKSPP